MVSRGPLFDHARHQADDARLLRQSAMNRRSLLRQSLALGLAGQHWRRCQPVWQCGARRGAGRDLSTGGEPGRGRNAGGADGKDHRGDGRLSLGPVLRRIQAGAGGRGTPVRLRVRPARRQG